MGDGQEQGKPARWMVQGPDVSSGALLEQVKSDPGVRMVRRVAADTVILQMTPVRAQQLKADFGRELVEIDADMDLYG